MRWSARGAIEQHRTVLFAHYSAGRDGPRFLRIARAVPFRHVKPGFAVGRIQGADGGRVLAPSIRFARGMGAVFGGG